MVGNDAEHSDDSGYNLFGDRETKLMLKVSTYSAPVLIGGMVARLNWGIEGVAIGYTSHLWDILFLVFALLGCCEYCSVTFLLFVGPTLVRCCPDDVGGYVDCEFHEWFPRALSVWLWPFLRCSGLCLSSFVINRKQTEFIPMFCVMRFRKVEIPAA